MELSLEMVSNRTRQWIDYATHDFSVAVNRTSEIHERLVVARHDIEVAEVAHKILLALGAVLGAMALGAAVNCLGALWSFQAGSMIFSALTVAVTATLAHDLLRIASGVVRQVRLLDGILREVDERVHRVAMGEEGPGNTFYNTISRPFGRVVVGGVSESCAQTWLRELDDAEQNYHSTILIPNVMPISIPVGPAQRQAAGRRSPH